MNTYGYVGGNPLTRRDSKGLDIEDYEPYEIPEHDERKARFGVFGCGFIGATYIQGDKDAQITAGGCFGGGLMICSPADSDTVCENEKKAEERRKHEYSHGHNGCGIYDPNCDNQASYGYSTFSRGLGLGIGVSQSGDGGFCVQVGPFVSLPISENLGTLDE